MKKTTIIPILIALFSLSIVFGAELEINLGGGDSDLLSLTRSEGSNQWIYVAQQFQIPTDADVTGVRPYISSKSCGYDMNITISLRDSLSNSDLTSMVTTCNAITSYGTYAFDSSYQINANTTYYLLFTSDDFREGLSASVTFELDTSPDFNYHRYTTGGSWGGAISKGIRLNVTYDEIAQAPAFDNGSMVFTTTDDFNFASITNLTSTGDSVGVSEVRDSFVRLDFDSTSDYNDTHVYCNTGGITCNSVFDGIANSSIYEDFTAVHPAFMSDFPLGYYRKLNLTLNLSIPALADRSIYFYTANNTNSTLGGGLAFLFGLEGTSNWMGANTHDALSFNTPNNVTKALLNSTLVGSDYVVGKHLHYEYLVYPNGTMELNLYNGTDYSLLKDGQLNGFYPEASDYTDISLFEFYINSYPSSAENLYLYDVIGETYKLADENVYSDLRGVCPSASSQITNISINQVEVDSWTTKFRYSPDNSSWSDWINLTVNGTNEIDLTDMGLGDCLYYEFMFDSTDYYTTSGMDFEASYITDYTLNEEFVDLSNLTVDVTGATGRVVFDNNLNLTDHSNYLDNIVFGQNWVFVNSTEVPPFNSSAEVTLFNTGIDKLAHVRVLKDGVECVDCTNIQYNGGNVTFDTTGFSNVSVESTCSLTQSADYYTDVNMSPTDYCEGVWFLQFANGSDLNCNGAVINNTVIGVDDPWFYRNDIDGGDYVVENCNFGGFDTRDYPIFDGYENLIVRNSNFSIYKGEYPVGQNGLFRANANKVFIFENNYVERVQQFLGAFNQGTTTIRNNTINGQTNALFGQDMDGINVVNNTFTNMRFVNIYDWEDFYMADNEVYGNQSTFLFNDATTSNVVITRNNFYDGKDVFIEMKQSPSGISFYENNINYSPTSYMACTDSCVADIDISVAMSGNYYLDAPATDLNTDGFVDGGYTLGTGSNDSYAYVDYSGWLNSYTETFPPTEPVFTYPIGGEVITSNPISIMWTESNGSETIYYNISYSTDNSSWTNIIGNQTGDTYVWDASALSDGSPYYLKMYAEYDTGFSSSEVFIDSVRLNIVPPTAPTISYPNGGEVIDKGDSINITWATSTSDETVTYTVQTSDNNGSTWTNRSTQSGTFYVLDTTALTSSSEYLVRVIADDGFGQQGSDVSDAVFEISEVLSIDWDSYPEINGTYHSDSLGMQFEIISGDKNVTCELIVDGVVNLTGSYATNGLEVLTYVVDNSTPAKLYELDMNCSTAFREVSLTTKYINIDVFDPTITVNTPTLMNQHLPSGVPVDVEFFNHNLQETQFLLYNGSNDLVLNITNTSHSGNYSRINFTLTTELELGDMRIELSALDNLNHTHAQTVYLRMFNCVELVEDWQVAYTNCSVADDYVEYYVDANSCDTTFDLPVANGTVHTCNYCTIDYTSNIQECVAGDSFVDSTYTYNNYDTCCALTNITADCDIPANYTTKCIGIHDSDDLSGIVVDNIVEVGSEGVKYAPLVALFTLGTTILAILI